MRPRGFQPARSFTVAVGPNWHGFAERLPIVASDEPWVGIPEVAAHLHMSTDTAYRWVDTPGLTAHRVGHLFRFRRPQVVVWVQSRGGGIPATKSPGSPARDNGDRSANG